jgi:hypothetical protein
MVASKVSLAGPAETDIVVMAGGLLRRANVTTFVFGDRWQRLNYDAYVRWTPI